MAFVVVQHLDPETREPSDRIALQRKQDAGLRSNGRDSRRGQSRLRDCRRECNLGISAGVLRTPPRPASWPQHADGRFSSRTWRRTSAARPSASFYRERRPMERWACRRSRPRVVSPSPRKSRTAKFDGMPKSAIAAGVVDYVLPPAGIARQLVALARVTSPPRKTCGVAVSRRRCGTGPDTPAGAERHGRGLHALQARHPGAAHQAPHGPSRIRHLEDYSRDLEQNREEATALCENCFITVTAFFREPAVFDELKKTVFPALVENRAPEDPIRIWVPGCASGEEAYSIAICLMEFLDETGSSFPIEIFATDISQIGHRKSPRRHIHGRRAGACLAAATGALLHPVGTRVPDCQGASATSAFLPGTTWRRTRLSPSWT